MRRSRPSSTRPAVGRPQRRSQLSLPPWALVAAAVGCFALGVIAAASTRPRTPDGGGPPTAARTSDGREDASARSRPTRAGAVAAATAFLDSMPWRVLISDERRRDVIRRLAVGTAQERLDGYLAQGVGDVRRVVRAAPVVARPVTIGYRVERFSGRRATVSVWGLALFGSAAYEPVSQWATSTLKLVWQRDAWKVAAIRNRSGPSPRWSIEELAAETASFRRYRHVP